jgi:hypothetical protein
MRRGGGTVSRRSRPCRRTSQELLKDEEGRRNSLEEEDVLVDGHHRFFVLTPLF